MEGFKPNPFEHIGGETNDIEKAQLKMRQAERKKAKRVRGVKSVVASAGVIAAIGLGAHEMAVAKSSSTERQTPGREAQQNPAVAAAEKSAQDFAAAKELGGSPVAPTAEEQRQAESGTLKNPE